MQFVRKRGDFGEWHTFDACARLGIREPLGGNLWDHFDAAMISAIRAKRVSTFGPAGAQFDRMIIAGYTPHGDHLRPPGVNQCPLIKGSEAVM
jgi:hypothetical protein